MIISAYRNKYAINKMCRILNISRSYYYKLNRLKQTIINIDKMEKQQQTAARIKSIYESSKMMYGSRKIAAMLSKENISISPFKVLKHMKISGLSSLYNKKRKFKTYPNKSKSTTLLTNELSRKFQRFNFREVISSDLTHIPFQNKFLYVCFVIDLYNREIVAHGVSDKHDSQFVYETLGQINLYKVGMFHSDRGSEFINKQIGELLEKTNTIHSVSKAGCPCDNAVSENLFGIFKREWLKSKYDTISKLKNDVDDFVHNYNHFRIHSTLNYQSPIEFRLSN